MEYKDPVGNVVGVYERSFALLIGVSSYTANWPERSHVADDLDDLAAALSKHGFQVEAVLDPEEGLRAVFARFIESHGRDAQNRLLFFFAGHGWTLGDGDTGYLVPADAPNPSLDRPGFVVSALPVAQIVTWTQTIEANHALFLFDSCLPGTVLKTPQRTDWSSDISNITSRRVRQFITAGSAGEVMPSTSVFVPALIRALDGNADFNRDGFVTGTELGAYVQQKLLDDDVKQAPQYGKLSDPDFDRRGEFVFRLPPDSGGGVKRPEPGGEVERPEPGVEVEPEEPGADVEPEEPGGEVERPEPGIRVEPEEPGGEVERPEPGAGAEPEEPGGEVERPEPGVGVSGGEVERPEPGGGLEPAKPDGGEERLEPRSGVERPGSGIGYVPPEDEVQRVSDLRRALLPKVVGLSDNISIVAAPGSSKVLSRMEPLKPYFVLEKSARHYRISSRQGESDLKQFVSKKEVAVWNTREGLRFLGDTFRQRLRASVRAWESKERILQYARTGKEGAYEPDFGEEAQMLTGDHGIVPYPVLTNDKVTDHEGKIRRIYQVLVPAIVAVETDLTSQEVQDVAGAVTFCVVFDATASMKEHATDFADTIDAMLSEADFDVERAAVGFVFFRDVTDSQPFERYNPMPLRRATSELRRRTRGMIGGDDPAEPVLDAMMLARNSFLWNAGTAFPGAKRIAIVVANNDAKLQTVGLTRNIPKDLTAEEVGRLLSASGISVFALQAGPEDHGNLIKVLSTLAVETGGEFYRATVGSRRKASHTEDVTKRFSKSLKKLLSKTIDEGNVAARRILSGISPRKEGGTVIALDVLDGGIRKRLEERAREYHVSTVGLVITKAWVFEEPELYREEILIEKELLEWLVRFFNDMTDSTLDTTALRESMEAQLRALTGESLPEGIELQELLEKRLGIHFSTILLDFELDELATLDPVKRSLVVKRIREATADLADFLDRNTKRFNTEPRIWMPVRYLP